MIYYCRVAVNESKDNKECIVCHCWYFDNGFKFKRSVCKGCHDILMISHGINDIAVIIVKGINYDIKNHTCYYFDDIININDFVLDNILFDKKSYQKIFIYHAAYKTLNNENLCVLFLMK